MPKRGSKRPTKSLHDRVQTRIMELGKGAHYQVVGPNVVIKKKDGASASVVWSSGNRQHVAFFICVDGKIYGELVSMVEAQKKWQCKLLLVLRSLSECQNAMWLADSYNLADYRSVTADELGAKLARNTILKEWLGV